MQSRALDDRRQNKIGQVGRDAVWTAIRSFPGEFTVSDIEEITRQPITTIRDYIRGLTHAGYLRAIDNGKAAGGRYKKGRWVLINNVGLERPYVDKMGIPTRQYPGREAMWRTMRIMQDFSSVDLAVNASTAGHQVVISEAQVYISALYKAGILRCTQKATHNSKARYILINSKNNGPLPPAVQRTKQVFDRNTGTVVWTEPKGSDE